MKPYRQGKFSRYCSIYATMSAINLLGIKLKAKEWQNLYDHIIMELNNYQLLYDISINGAEQKKLEAIFIYASDFLLKYKKVKLSFKRQYWTSRPLLNVFITDVKQALVDKNAVICCIQSPHFNHYTNINRITKEKLVCFDSCNLKDISLKNIRIEQGGHYQIKYRCVYFLSVKPD